MIFWTLGQSSAERAPGEILPVLFGLIGLVIAGGIVVLLLRRFIYRSESKEPGFTLQDLRDMHASGQITDEEFDRARMQMIGRAGAQQRPDKPRISAGNAAE